MSRTFILILFPFILLVACTAAPTASPVPTNTPLPTATPQPTNTPLLTSTTTTTATPTSTETPKPTSTPTLTPTPAIKVPEYSIIKYYVDSNFDDGQRQFSEWTRGLDKKWQSDTSKIVIIDDPTNSGRGKVAAFYLTGPGAAFDQKHRLDLMVDGTAPNFADFNPGTWGASVDFYFEPGHDSFTTRSDSRNSRSLRREM